MSSRAFVTLVVSAILGVTAIVVAGVVFVVSTMHPPATVTAEPGQETFELLRLTDGELSHLGLTASEAGVQPSTLATVVSDMQVDWRDASGQPDACLFTGGYPAQALFPVWGTEDESAPLWKDKSVSASQSLRLGDQSMAWVSYRVFRDADAALAYLLEHNEFVPECSEFTVTDFQRTTTTTVSPLLVDSIPASNSGWVAITEGWVSAGSPESAAVDLQTWVLNIARGPVVARLVMLLPASEPDAGPFFTELASVVSARLAARISE